jgi:ribonuclease HI
MSENTIYVYVDGSATGNVNVTEDTIAGWAIIGIRGNPGIGHDKGHRLFANYGRVTCDATDINYLGAEVGSNNTAELSAFNWALEYTRLYCFGHDEDISKYDLIIMTDSLYAGNMIDGEWKAKKNLKMIQHVRKTYFSCKREFNSIEWRHVRAHSNNYWNDKVDLLAKRGCTLCLHETGAQPVGADLLTKTGRLESIVDNAFGN